MFCIILNQSNEKVPKLESDELSIRSSQRIETYCAISFPAHCARARAHVCVCVCVCVRVNGSVSVGTVVNFKTRSFVFVILPNVKRCYIKLFMFDCLGFQSCCTVVAFTCFQIILMIFA